ncbi:MAG: Ig-like domain-containing protein, partial [Burkholderiales bacterium]|nr:Ig-like domain-containing protein [Phycisphaerae bacterium]
MKSGQTSDNNLEGLEHRQLMAAGTVVSLPFRLDFNATIADSIVDKDGEGTGLTRVQANKLGTEYQPALIDLNTTTGRLNITSTGTSSAGSSGGTDNTQANALETQFDGTSSGLTITARLIGPLSNLASSYQSAGIYLGIDQDNLIKFTAINMGSGTGSQYLQFKDEFDTGSGPVSSRSDTLNRVSIGSFASITTLDLRIIGDALNGTVNAYYSVNGGAFAQFGFNYTVPTSKQAQFFSTTARTGLMVSQKNNAAPITAIFDSFEITAGQSLGNRPSVTATRPANGETNVNRDIFIAADVNLPNSGGGVDTATINTSNVKLIRASDGALIGGVINTTGGGDAIVFTPSSPLAAYTSYTFQITHGVKDTTGSPFMPYSATFTTGNTGGTVDTSISFTKTAQTLTQGSRYTSLAFGPDHKLYATTIDGKIMRWNVAADGSLSAAQQILTIQNMNGGHRSTISIVFDPASTANNLIAYVSHSDFAGLELKEYESENLGQASNWTGKVTKLTGANLQTGQDIVTGLPRSVRDHQNYQMAFGPDGKLYISQSSMSAMGSPDNAWGNKAEVLMSASILQIDTAAIGASTINVRTEGVANPYNPFAVGAPVALYATGLRSAYDILFHRNGKMYSATNGSAAGGNTPGGGGAAALTNVATQDDFLFKINQGAYYG